MICKILTPAKAVSAERGWGSGGKGEDGLAAGKAEIRATEDLD